MGATWLRATSLVTYTRARTRVHEYFYFGLMVTTAHMYVLFFFFCYFRPARDV